MLTILAAVLAVVGLTSVETPDARTRTYISPARIVWQTKQGTGFGDRAQVLRAEKLLSAVNGQVPESGWGADAADSRCVMINEGFPASIILDFGKELHGGLQLAFGRGPNRDMRFRVRFGESVSETMSDIGEKGATNDHAMRDEIVTVPLFGTIELGNTGFRFVRLDLISNGQVTLDSVRAIALMRPMVQRGYFKCSDARLNQIWETAARTVHLCCQDYLWDGIKRDRLVWMGDTHPETMAILAIYGAAPVLPESLEVMERMTKPDQWMNTMPTYSCWWIRNLAEWYRYTGDKEYLKKHADYLEATFDHILTGFDADGWWRAGNFLDWPTRHNDAAATAGTQGLVMITARETVYLAEALGRDALKAKAQTAIDKLAKLKPEPHGEKSAAAMLALSGLRTPREMFDEVLGQNGHERVSTFYGYYMLEAMSAAGENARALKTVRDYWGAMVDMGATSFWEDFKLAWTNNAYRIDEMPVAGKKDIHGDYGEFCYPGFRHSLCHGWSCGPAQWLINHVLGIQPKGANEVAVKPFLGDLEWAEGAYALANGKRVWVRVEKGSDGELKVTKREE